MLADIGGKIKSLAKLICWLGIIASIITGIIIIFERHREKYTDYIRDSWNYNYFEKIADFLDIFLHS